MHTWPVCKAVRLFVCVFMVAESTAMCSCVRSSRALSPVLLPRLLLPQTGYRLAGRSLWTTPHCMAVSGDSQLLPLPSQARVVICGGGVVGSSVAFHLAKMGWTDIVLLEQGRWDNVFEFIYLEWLTFCESSQAQQCLLSHQLLSCDFHVIWTNKESFYIWLDNALLMLCCMPRYLVCRLGAGTTRLCAGIVSVAKPLSIECQMANYSNSLYQQLEEQTGVKTGQPPEHILLSSVFHIFWCCSWRQLFFFNMTTTCILTANQLSRKIFQMQIYDLFCYHF